MCLYFWNIYAYHWIIYITNVYMKLISSQPQQFYIWFLLVCLCVVAVFPLLSILTLITVAHARTQITIRSIYIANFPYRILDQLACNENNCFRKNWIRTLHQVTHVEDSISLVDFFVFYSSYSRWFSLSTVEQQQKQPY